MRRPVKTMIIAEATALAVAVTTWVAGVASGELAAGCLLPPLAHLLVHAAAKTARRKRVLFSGQIGGVDLAVTEISPLLPRRPRIRQIEVPGALYSRATIFPGAPASLMTFFPRIIDPLLPENSPSHLLMLGAGGGGLIRYYLEQRPECRITGVDLEPEMLKIAEKYFLFDQEMSRCRLICSDAMDFLEKLPPARDFNAVCIDLFSGAQPPPVSLSPKLWRIAFDHLAPGGVVVANLLNADPDDLGLLSDSVRQIGSFGLFVAKNSIPVAVLAADSKLLREITRTCGLLPVASFKPRS